MRKRFWKTMLLTLLISVLLLGTASAESGLKNFRPVNRYTGQFQDVSASAWYADSVAQAYSYGLIQGKGANAFDPGGNLTVAECVTLAARLHSTYLNDGMVFKQGDPWYQVYVDYALENDEKDHPRRLCGDHRRRPAGYPATGDQRRARGLHPRCDREALPA